MRIIYKDGDSNGIAIFDLNVKVPIIAGTNCGLELVLASAKGMDEDRARVVVSGRKIDDCNAAAEALRAVSAFCLGQFHEESAKT